MKCLLCSTLQSPKRAHQQYQGIRECTQGSLAGSEVLSYFAYVPVPCVYLGQPLVVAGSRNHPLLNDVTALVD